MPDDALPTIVIMVLTMTAGTGVIMWMGELITDRGIGNGMSVLIFTSIAARFPGSLWAIQQQQRPLGRLHRRHPAGLRDHRAGHLRRAVPSAGSRCSTPSGRSAAGCTAARSTYIPLKVNMAGVIPVIFASSLLSLPALVAQFNRPERRPPAGWVDWVQGNLVRGDHPIYMLLYVALILFFTFFYVSITFNPTEVADNMKKYGGFIPGIRAGRPTAEYLDYVLTRITVPGALYLGLISLIPLIALVLVDANQNFPFGGTSILIIVGVGLETVKQIESQLQQRHYEGFLR